MGTPMLLIDIITIERIVAAAVWAFIIYTGLPCVWRVMSGDIRKAELTMAIYVLIGVGILIFQWRALLGYTPVLADYFVAVALFSFCFSGIAIVVSRVAHAPEEHQRQILIAHSIVLVCLTMAGLLAA